jgi:2-oxo-3-hexenedioate decarboxylase
MPTAHELHDIAAILRSAQDTCRQIEPITSRHSDFDGASAYAVAELIHQARIDAGATPVGRKIGFTNYTIWPEYGVDAPMWAYVYDTTVVRLGVPPHRCSIGRFAEPKIEPEIVFHFREAPPPHGDVAAVLACVDWVAHGFEVVQSHYPGWRFRLADTIADSGLHATLLVGEPRPVASIGGDLVAALETFTLTLSRDGRAIDVGVGANVLGSPLAAIVHLLGVLEADARRVPVAAGEIVTTGTITAAHPVRAGETWETMLQGLALPGLRVEFVA